MNNVKSKTRSIDELGKKRRPLFISTERTILKYFADQPDAKPDGSFIHAEWLAGFEAGRRFEKRSR